MPKLTVNDLQEIKKKTQIDVATRLGVAPDGAALEAGHASKHLLLCGGTGCHATGSIGVKDALMQEIAKRGREKDFQVVETGCNEFAPRVPSWWSSPTASFTRRSKPMTRSPSWRST